MTSEDWRDTDLELGKILEARKNDRSEAWQKFASISEAEYRAISEERDVLRQQLDQTHAMLNALRREYQELIQSMVGILRKHAPDKLRPPEIGE